MVAHGVFHQALGLDRGKAVFGLAHKFRLADKARHQRTAPGQQVFAGDLRGLAVVDQLAIGADAFQDGGPETGLVGAALGGGDGVTVRLDEPIACGGPVDGPFHLAGGVEFFLKIHRAGKGAIGIGAGVAQGFFQVIGQTTGKVKRGLAGGFAIGDGRFPANFHTRKQIGLRAHHFQKPRGFEPVAAKNLLVGVKCHRGAAAVGGCAQLCHRAQRRAARKTLFVKLFVAGHLHDHAV